MMPTQDLIQVQAFVDGEEAIEYEDLDPIDDDNSLDLTDLQVESIGSLDATVFALRKLSWMSLTWKRRRSWSSW